jgi:hypothetical protein
MVNDQKGSPVNPGDKVNILSVENNVRQGIVNLTSSPPHNQLIHNRLNNLAYPAGYYCHFPSMVALTD